jgi:N-formylglutamate deformylase
VVRAAKPIACLVELPHAAEELSPEHAAWLRVPAYALAKRAPLADADTGVAALWEESEAQGVGRVVARVHCYVVDLAAGPPFAPPLDPRVPPGLGDVRIRSHAGVVWSEPPRSPVLAERLRRELYEPYHERVASELALLLAKHERVLLVSAHTFPSRPGDADVVLGTKRGSTAPEALRDALGDALTRDGLRVAMEHPFPGSRALSRHASERVVALQLEVGRHLVCPGWSQPGAHRLDVDARTAAALGRRLVRALVRAVEDVLPRVGWP